MDGLDLDPFGIFTGSSKVSKSHPNAGVEGMVIFLLPNSWVGSLDVFQTIRIQNTTLALTNALEGQTKNLVYMH